MARPMASHPVHQRVRKLQSQLVAFLKKFLEIPTVNPPGARYGDCIGLLEKKLRGLGLETKVYRVPKAEQERLNPGYAEYPRYNIVARWDTGAKKTLHYSGHYDVVPATLGWKTDAFKPYIKGNKLVARGTQDMKGCDTAALFAVQALLESGAKPAWNIELSFTADEETGGQAGLGWLVHKKLVKPDAAVLLEGGAGDDIGYSHRGVLWSEYTVYGTPAHGSNPKGGINALEKAIFLIGEMKKLERAFAKRRTKFLADGAAKTPTIMFGGVSGGGAKVNVIPDRFRFTIDRRVIPEEKKAQVKAELERIVRAAQRKDRELKVSVREFCWVDPGITKLGAPILENTLAAHRAVTGRRGRFRMMAGFTDMHYFTEDAGVPTVGYGVKGAGLHGDFEYCTLDGLREAASIYAELALRMR